MKKTGELTMKRIALAIQLRTIIATVLTVSFIAVPLHLPSACAASAAIEVKTESEYKSEAARFATAISAVAAIATMRLETGDDLKKAIVILDRERPNLRLHRSKLVTLCLSDPTFTGALKKRATTLKSAETLVKEIEADPKIVLKLEGAASLTTRIQRSAEADAATLRRVADRLKEAAERIKQASPGAGSSLNGGDEFRLARVGFNTEMQPVHAAKSVMVPQVEIVVILIIATGVVCALIGYFAGRMTNYLDLRDDIAECQESADTNYSRCIFEARDLPSGFPLFLKEAAIALCYSGWLGRQALCLVAG